MVCISPLTSLVIDQKSKFIKMNLKAEYVGEAQTDEKAISRVLKGDIQILLISPESLLLNPRFRNMLLSKPYKDDLVALVVDEAHCVKTRSVTFNYINIVHGHACTPSVHAWHIYFSFTISV